MTLASKFLARLARLPPARRGEVDVERDVRITMPDGVVLLADHWFPVGVDRPPLIVMRSPCGRRQLGLAIVARVFAERGYGVFIQSTRGSFGSAGGWEPFRSEASDGAATHGWIAEQPWFGEISATFGPSYLGLTQWALTADPPASLRAMSLAVTASSFRDAAAYPGGTFSLETGAAWIDLIESQERTVPRILWAHARARKRLDAVYRTLPLSQADWKGFKRPLNFYQDWLIHEQPDDPWWDPLDFGRQLDRVPPASMIAGWYDLFLPAQLGDFLALRSAGRTVRITVGPWPHISGGGALAQLRDGLEWFDEQIFDRPPTRRHAGVRLFVLGTRRWVDLESWPPPATVQRWHLHPGGRLDPLPPPQSDPDDFFYDPADPTPSLGGPSLNWRSAGRRDQAERERRPGVLSFSSDLLVRDVTVAGPLAAEIWLRSDAPSSDVFVRLCDVDEQGVSHNVSDGILRLPAERTGVADDRARLARVTMWPTAITFARGHRLRLQVSAGAHPLFARNLGSGERLGSAITLVVAHQEIFHDPAHPSAINLPISPI